MGYLSREQLEKMGFRSLGKNVLISDKASIYNAGNISIGTNSRIDDFAILSAGVDGLSIGRHVHIGAYTSLVGRAAIEIDDFCGISLHCSVFTSSDDFAAAGLNGPTIPMKYRKIHHAAVRLERFSTLGSTSVLLPGAVLSEGVSVGVLSVVNRRLEPWGVYAGYPARRLSDRPMGNIREYADELLRNIEAV